MSQDDLYQLKGLLKFAGGSLKLAAFLGLLLTIAFAAAGFLLIEPFRSGRISGSYWSLIAYDEILQRWLGPVSAVSFLVVLGLPFANRHFSQQPRPQSPAIVKVATGVLLLATVVAWVIIGVSSFRHSGYRHEDDLVQPGKSYFLATWGKERQREGATYIVYSCNQIGMNCQQIYSQNYKPTGIYSYSVKGQDYLLQMDQKSNRLEIRLRHYNESIYVPL